jgi:hypothetical protein
MVPKESMPARGCSGFCHFGIWLGARPVQEDIRKDLVAAQ